MSTFMLTHFLVILPLKVLQMSLFWHQLAN